MTRLQLMHILILKLKPQVKIGLITFDQTDLDFFFLLFVLPSQWKIISFFQISVLSEDKNVEILAFNMV